MLFSHFLDERSENASVASHWLALGEAHFELFQPALSLAGSCAGRVYELGKRTEKPNNGGEEQSPKPNGHRAEPNDGGELAHAPWAKRVGQCVLGFGQCVLSNNGGEMRL